MPKKLLLIFLIVLIALIALLLYYLRGSKPTITNQKSKVLVGNQEFLVDVAQTPAEKERGLVGRNYLNGNEGMLFIYEKPELTSFWMKNMLISIDLIWIKNDQVIGFEENLLPDSGGKLYNSPDKIDFVLEIKAGETDKRRLKVGERVVVKNIAP